MGNADTGTSSDAAPARPANRAVVLATPSASFWAAAAVVLFVAALGLAPHARFSALSGELAYFKYAYDEDTYFLFMARGVFVPYRFISDSLNRVLYDTFFRPI